MSDSVVKVERVVHAKLHELHARARFELAIPIDERVIRRIDTATVKFGSRETVQCAGWFRSRSTRAHSHRECERLCAAGKEAMTAT